MVVSRGEPASLFPSLAIRSEALPNSGNIAITIAICCADSCAACGPSSFCQYFKSNSANSFICGMFGPNHISVVITMPPASSRV
jgi:hypothetical protein